MDIRLVDPTLDLKEQFLEFYMEWKLSGERISPGILRTVDPTRFEEMVQYLLELREIEGLTKGQTPQSVYWLVRESNCILGAVTIRHQLTERLLNVDGHIGAGIRPSQRRNGYATKILTLACEKAQEIGIKEVLVTCNEDNIGSEKAIIHNGGVRDSDFLEDHGNIVKRYWISL